MLEFRACGRISSLDPLVLAEFVCILRDQMGFYQSGLTISLTADKFKV